MSFVNTLQQSFANVSMYNQAQQNGNIFYIKCINGFVVYDSALNESSVVYVDTSSNVGGIALSADRKLLAYASGNFPGNNTLSLYSLTNPKVPALIFSRVLGGNCMRPVILGNYVFGMSNWSGGNNPQVAVYDFNGNLLTTYNYNYFKGVYFIDAISVDNNILFIGTKNSENVTVVSSVDGINVSSGVITNYPGLNWLSCTFNGNQVLITADSNFYILSKNFDIVKTGAFNQVSVSTNWHGYTSLSLSGRYIYVSVINGNPQFFSFVKDIYDGQVFYSSEFMVGGLTFLNGSKFIAYDYRGGNVYYGNFEDTAFINEGLSINNLGDDEGACKLLNYYRPVSVLGKYKS